MSQSLNTVEETQTIKPAIDENNLSSEAVIALLAQRHKATHAADIADYIEQSTQVARSEILEWLCENDVKFLGDVLSEVDESLRQDILSVLPNQIVRAAFDGLDSDDVVDILEGLTPDRRNNILSLLDKADQIIAQQGLNFPLETAGRLMQRETVIVPEHWNFGR